LHVALRHQIKGGQVADRDNGRLFIGEIERLAGGKSWAGRALMWQALEPRVGANAKPGRAKQRVARRETVDALPDRLDTTGPVDPKTRWLIWNLATRGPTASITPADSEPGMVVQRGLRIQIQMRKGNPK